MTDNLVPKGELERLLARLPHLDPQHARQLLMGMIPQVKAKAVEDGVFWLRFVRTRDEADPQNPVKPFPIYDYVPLIWNELVANNRVVVAKSRQMLMSWIAAAFCVWWARHKPHQGVYWQTKKWEDAVAAVCMPAGGVLGRCQFIEDYLPQWMKTEYQGSAGRMQYANGSVIQACAGGADQVRGKTISLIVEDEFAFQEDQDGVYTTVAPLIQKASKGIFISSPNGTSNCFATLYHGRDVSVELPV